jgi:hypothetical protein
MKAQYTENYTGISGALDDLYAGIEARRVANERPKRPWAQYSLYAKSDCTIQINGATDAIPVYADVPFSGQANITGMVLVESGIEFSLVVEY